MNRYRRIESFRHLAVIEDKATHGANAKQGGTTFYRTNRNDALIRPLASGFVHGRRQSGDCPLAQQLRFNLAEFDALGV
ncbi:MAG: hypothetical protein ACPGVU_14015 [Limisphaerales bacterium]